MEQEVKDDLYAEMGGIMMYLEESITSLETTKSKISKLIFDAEIPTNMSNKLYACNKKIRDYVVELGVIRKYINDIDLTT